MGTAANDQDVFGDDTVRATVPIQEAGGTGLLNAVAGCEIARRPAPGGGPVATSSCGAATNRASSICARATSS
jgi:hypothetical protein